MATLDEKLTAALRSGLVIPAHPLALTGERRLDERRQRALSRYYLDAGAGGLAVAVHTTQFAIREHGMLRPVLELAVEEARAHERRTGHRAVLVAGVCGKTAQAVAEAELCRDLGYDLALLNLAALSDASDDELIAHCRTVAGATPLFGFYLQPAVGGRVLGPGFWRRFATLDGVAAIKVAPFDRYRTLDVVRAVAEVGRAGEVALYTGNDDNIVADLLTEFRTPAGGAAGELVVQHFAGGLLGHWAVWTSRAVELLSDVHAARATGVVPQELLARGAQITDCNAAVFDAANAFRGCVPGVHEVLRRQGLCAGTFCLDPDEGLSEGQAERISRVCRAYPHLGDDAFVRDNLDRWLA